MKLITWHEVFGMLAMPILVASIASVLFQKEVVDYYPAEWVIGICVVWVIAIIISRILSQSRNTKIFNKIFSVSPPRSKDWKKRSVLQPVVDKVITSLALEFKKACKAEEQITSKKESHRYRDSVRKREGIQQLVDGQLNKLKQADEKVVETKKVFWQAYYVADEFGFQVNKGKEIVKQYYSQSVGLNNLAVPQHLNI
ncbi:MAG: hypothetical protein ABIJ83_02515 [Patescibacteria group bacterium]